MATEDEGIVPGGGSELKGELNRALFIGKQGGLDLPVDQPAVEGVKLDGNAGAESGFGGGDLQQVGGIHFQTAEMAVPVLGTGDFLATPADGDFGPASGRGDKGLRRGSGNPRQRKRDEIKRYEFIFHDPLWMALCSLI